MSEEMTDAHFHRILVVDDATANLQLLTNILSEQGYIVHPASDGELALRFVQSILPDLILLDIRMPGMDGYEVCRRLRREERTRAIPIIFISVLEDEGDKVKGFQEGAVDYITKPFRPEEVLARIRIHLRLRELTEHLERTVATRTAELHAANAQLQQLNETLEQRVAQRTAALEAANEELEAFAYSVSHDLRAPLRYIDGFVGLLEKSTAAALDQESRHYMATISESAKLMGTLIDDLLSFSRMGRQEMSRMAFDLGVLVREVVREFGPETEGRCIRWHVADLPAVTGDPAMLRQVLVNLVSNSLKFTRPRQQAEITIGCLPGKEDETVVFVRDNGVGFDPDYAHKLFGVFQRLHRVDEFEGTGIGLANVRRIVGRHGGRTWAEGAIDRGAAFYFSLPQTAERG